MRPIRTYDVIAVQVPIAYNSYGDHDRDGMIFALAGREAELRALRDSWPEPFPHPIHEPRRLPRPHPLVRPLVLRARVGERVVVRFRNDTGQRAGIHPQGVGYDVVTADGCAVGRNPDSSAAPRGGRRKYVWDCDHEGVFFFCDLADLHGDEHGSQARGLFGALVVEPEGATWTDPATGAPLSDGLYADVHLPDRPSFREYVLFLQDGAPNDSPVPIPVPALGCRRWGPHTHAPAAGGNRLTPEYRVRDDDPDQAGAGGNEATTLVSYRSEPSGWRAFEYQRLLDAGRIDPVRDAVAGEEQQLSSWLFGDPATPVLHAYRGDRARLRLVNAGVAATQTFHLHQHRWHAVPGESRSPLTDVVTLGPQQADTVEPVGGAGSVHGAVGDMAWHCHPDSRGATGTGQAWGLWRVFDTVQDGTGRYPDGTVIAPLRPLPGHEPPPRPTAQRPGFPAFIPGRFPQRAPRPPRTPGMPAGMGREPTSLEAAAFCRDPQPGEAFTKVAPHSAAVRRYHLVAMQGTLRHFRRFPGEGGPEPRARSSLWQDGTGLLLALADDVAAAGGVVAYQRELAAGIRDAEPVVIRARRGEVVEVTLTNALPPGCQPETEFEPVLPFQPECGLHAHLVRADPLVADGASAGWNYLSGAVTTDAGHGDRQAYRSWVFRWYCDEEVTAVFHDQLLPAERGRHGFFGCLVVEPRGARWMHPQDPAVEVRSGAQAVIALPGGGAFREQVLAVADGVVLRRYSPGGQPRPVAPARPDDPDSSGGIGVNYRCEPLGERPGDPADWFASAVHGDPGTPVLCGYPGERLRLRVYQGTPGRQHAFTIGGMRWPGWPADPGSPPRDSQPLGPYQAAELRVEEVHSPGDYLWSLVACDDVWRGGWGLVRLHDTPQPDLPALPGAFRAAALPQADAAPTRRYQVRARARPVRYSPARWDPHALVYEVDGGPLGEPLVLRCRVGEWVEVTLVNELTGPGQPSEFDPRLPEADDPASREISGRVSLHAGLVRCDVRTSDGAHVGRNTDGTVKPGQSITYRWYADTPGPVLLTDRADIRSHRHRGLVGVLVVEPADVVPRDPGTGAQRWVGEQVELHGPDGRCEHELVLLLQDGLRLYHEGDLTQPVRDLEDRPADAGQKAVSYRSAHMLPARPSLAVAYPGTPLLECRSGDPVRLHVLAATDRPRSHTFLLHGHTWPAAPHLDGDDRNGRPPGTGVPGTRPRAGPAEDPDRAADPGALDTQPIEIRRPGAPHHAARRRGAGRLGALGVLTGGSAYTLRFTARESGDYAYRVGALRWSLTEGLWGIVRVH